MVGVIWVFLFCHLHYCVMTQIVTVTWRGEACPAITMYQYTGQFKSSRASVQLHRYFLIQTWLAAFLTQLPVVLPVLYHCWSQCPVVSLCPSQLYCWLCTQHHTGTKDIAENAAITFDCKNDTFLKGSFPWMLSETGMHFTDTISHHCSLLFVL